MGPQKVSTVFESADLCNADYLCTAHRMILTGLGGIIVVEIYASIMQKEFQNTDNRIGKGFAILGIYLFVVAYCKTMHSLLSKLCAARDVS